MAHILAQKQLRSIILSVSVATSSFFAPPPSPLCFSFHLFLSLYMCLGLCLYTRVISEGKMTPAAPASAWLLCTVLIFSHLFLVSLSSWSLWNIFSLSSVPLFDFWFLIPVIYSPILYYVISSKLQISPVKHVISVFFSLSTISHTLLVLPFCSPYNPSLLEPMWYRMWFGATHRSTMRWPTSSMCCRCSPSTCTRTAWWLRWIPKIRWVDKWGKDGIQVSTLGKYLGLFHVF